MTPPTLLPVYTITAAVLALVACFLFVVLYARVRWERSAEGRNVMSLAVLLGVLIGVTLARPLVGPVVAQWVAAPTLALIAAVMFWRSALLVRAQRGHPHD